MTLFKLEKKINTKLREVAVVNALNTLRDAAVVLATGYINFFNTSSGFHGIIVASQSRHPHRNEQLQLLLQTV